MVYRLFVVVAVVDNASSA